MRAVILLIVSMTSFGWALSAEAGIACDAAYANNVTPNNGCELGSRNNDFLRDPLQVNVDTMFGFSDWEFAQKDNDLDGTDELAIDIGLALIGDQVSGTWSIDDVWAMHSDVMLVFKGGRADPTTYVGYLVPTGIISGSYLTPFSNLRNGNPKQISHVSVYVRGSGMQVSEPGMLALLGFGILALGLARRREN